METQGFQKGQEIFQEYQNNYCKFTFPKKAIIGKEFTIKLDKKVPSIELEIGDGISTYKPNRLTDPDGVERPLAQVFIKKTIKDAEEITVVLENITYVAGKPLNGLTPTQLLIGIYASGQGAEEQESKLIIMDCVYND